MTDNTLILVECALDENLDGAGELGFEILREKNYKTNRHLFLKKEGNDL